MSILALAGTVVSILLPYVVKGAEEFAKEAGKAAFERARGLFETLKTRWSGDREASDALTHFAQKPDRYQPILEEILTEKLGKDRELASLLSRLVQEMGPQLEVIQKMKVGKQITGIEAEQMTGGTAKVQQELEQGENVTGAKIKTIGPE